MNADLLPGANKELGKFSFAACIGGNTYTSEGNSLNGSLGDVVVKNLYSIANGNVKTESHGFSKS